MNHENLPEDQEAALVEEYLTALRKNPTVQAPAQLDPVMAKIILLTGQSEQAAVQPVASSMADVRARIWKTTLQNLDAEASINNLTQVEAIPVVPTKYREEENLAKPKTRGFPSFFPGVSSSKPRKLTWQRMMLVGMGSTVLLIVFAFSVFMVTTTASQEGGAYTNISIMASPTAVQVAPTVPAQPTPTPIPGYKVTLEVKFSNLIDFDLKQLDITGHVLETRLKALGVDYVKSSVVGTQIILDLRGVTDEDLVKKVVTTPGRIEFVAIGDETLQVGEKLQTTYCTSGSLLKPQAGLCGSSIPGMPDPQFDTTGRAKHLDGKPFQTIITGEDFDSSGIIVKPNDNQGNTLSFKLKPEAATVMKTFTGANLGHQMAITSDRGVLVSATIQGVISDAGEISTPTKQSFNVLMALLKSGPLPMSLVLVDMSGPK